MLALARTLLLALTAWIVLLAPACQAQAVANACSNSVVGTRCLLSREELGAIVVPRNVWDSLHRASTAAQDIAKQFLPNQLLADATPDAHPLLLKLSSKIQALAADARTLANISLPADTDILLAHIKRALPGLDTAPSQNACRATATRVLDVVEDVIVKLAMQQGWASADDVRAAFKPVAQRISDVVVFVCEFAEEHPPLVVAVVTMLVCVASRVPVLRLFVKPVLAFLGWGPLGPVQNSFAAWAQSSFFGGKVPAGSLFAWLQSVAMGGAVGPGVTAGVCVITSVMAGLVALWND